MKERLVFERRKLSITGWTMKLDVVEIVICVLFVWKNNACVTTLAFGL